MTLDQCYQANVGKALLIPGGGAGNEGQCVQWADTVLHDVYGQPYHWGNAIDWWNSPGELLNNFDKITDGSVKKGDFVIFNTLVGSPYGHIDVAAADGTTADFQGYDSNWGGNKTVHQVHHVGAQYVLGSLRPKGEDMGQIEALQQQIAGLQAELEGERKGYQALQDKANGLESELLAERKGYEGQIADLKAQLQQQGGGNVTVLKPGNYKVN